MPFHFCMDEVLMFLAMIPFIGMFFRKLHAWWHKKINHASHKKYSPYDRVPYEKISEEDAKYLRGKPVPPKITIPVVIERDNEQDPR